MTKKDRETKKVPRNESQSNTLDIGKKQKQIKRRGERAGLEKTVIGRERSENKRGGKKEKRRRQPLRRSDFT